MLGEKVTEPSESQSNTQLDSGGRYRWRWNHIGSALTILVGAFTLVGLHVKAYRTFSPIDERQHVDYLYRVSQGELLRMGEQIGQETLRDEACRGLDWDLFTPPPCHPNRPYDPNIYPNSGYNSAHIHPPTYYLLTNMVMKAQSATGVSRNFVSAARLAGGLWLGLGLLAFWYAAAELRVPPFARVVAIVLMVTTPTMLLASSTVNPDATSLLAGGALLLATLVWERKRGGTIYLIPLAGVLAVALKITNIVAVAAAGLYLLMRWWHQRHRTPNDSGKRGGYLLATVALVAAGIATALFWILIHNAIIRVPFDPQTEEFRVQSLSADAIVGQLLAVVTPVRDPWLVPFLNNAAVKAIVQLVNLGLVAAVFGAILYGRPGHPQAAVGISGSIVILGSGAIFTIMNYVLNSGTYVAIPPRYGMSAIPFLFLGLASAVRRPTVLGVTAVMGIASLLIVLAGMITAL